MRFVLRLTIWLRRIVVLGLLLALILGGPVAYVEYACTERDGNGRAPAVYAQLPGYFIAGAEADFARTLATGDAHQFGFWSVLTGYWTSLCGISERAAAEGGFSADTRRAIYARGAGFTGRMVARAAYEETLGRIMTLVRGPEKAPLDRLAATQAEAAAGLFAGPAGQRWDFGAAARALIDQNSGVPRDYERMIALNIGYRVRALLSDRVDLPALPEPPPLMMAGVTGIGAAALGRIEGLNIVTPAAEIDVETAAAREASATDAAPDAGTVNVTLPANGDAARLLTAIAVAGGSFAEISGRSGAVYLGLAGEGEAGPEAIAQVGSRRVVAVPVAELAPTLARLASGPVRAEAVFLP